jgi:hypothetical protein
MNSESWFTGSEVEPRRGLFLENLNDVFGVDSNGFAPAEEENHMKIFRRTELTCLVK